MSALTVGLIPVVLEIVKEGISLWKEERRNRFKKEHHEILKEIENAENQTYPEYTDSSLDLAHDRLQLFLQAYLSELRETKLEVL